MSGIEAMEQPTPEQLEAMYGGETLRGEASYFTQVIYSISIMFIFYLLISVLC